MTSDELSGSDIEHEIYESIKLTLCAGQTMSIDNRDSVLNVEIKKGLSDLLSYNLTGFYPLSMTVTDSPDSSGVLVRLERTAFR